MEELEMLDDIKFYDAAKKRKQNFVDAVKAFSKIDANQSILNNQIKN